MHLGLLTKKLVEESDILRTPKQRAGTVIIDQETINMVKNVYRSDDICRVCAGKRDYVTVIEENIRVAKQRRLIMMNLEAAKYWT